jgi:hypothetical protein
MYIVFLGALKGLVCPDVNRLSLKLAEFDEDKL